MWNSGKQGAEVTTKQRGDAAEDAALAHLQRHGLRLLMEAGAVGAVLGWWIGDYSALLAGAPALAGRTTSTPACAQASRSMFSAPADNRPTARSSGARDSASASSATATSAGPGTLCCARLPCSATTSGVWCAVPRCR